MAIGRTSPSALAGRTAIILVLLGAAAGLLNGLLGTGGGILLVYTMRLWAHQRLKDGSEQLAAQRDVYASALSVMLPISIFSAVHYARAGTLDMVTFSPLLLPSVIGGVLGGYLLDKLRIDWLKRLFALIVLCSGVLMIVRS